MSLCHARGRLLRLSLVLPCAGVVAVHGACDWQSASRCLYTPPPFPPKALCTLPTSDAVVVERTLRIIHSLGQDFM